MMTGQSCKVLSVHVHASANFRSCIECHAMYMAFMVCINVGTALYAVHDSTPTVCMPASDPFLAHY